MDLKPGSAEIVNSAGWRRLFPYVPGFLSFREIPAILQEPAQLTSPDI